MTVAHVDFVDPKLLRMRAYVRKSNKQDVDPTVKSVQVQINTADDEATANGWSFDKDTGVYVDDEIGGAEFAKRADLQRLLTDITQRPRPFDILHMTEGSRLGREMAETLYLRKLLRRAGIIVWQNGHEMKFTTAMEKMVAAFDDFASAAELERIRGRVTRAMHAKGHLGHMLTKVRYGYRAKERKRDHQGRSRIPADWVIFEPEAQWVRYIFRRAAEGAGLRLIAKELNAAAAPLPKNSNTKRRGEWRQSGVHSILTCSKYWGDFTWNKTQQSDDDGEKCYRLRPESEWIRITREDLRIVDDITVARGRAHREAVEDGLKKLGVVRRRGRISESEHLLVGLSRCGHCKGPMGVSGGVFACYDRRRRGAKTCANHANVPVANVEKEFLAALSKLLTNDQTRKDVLAVACAPPPAPPNASAVARIQREIKTLNRELDNLAELGAGKPSATIKRKIDEREKRKAELERQLTTASTPPRPRLDPKRAAVTYDRQIKNWKGLLKETATARRLLRTLLAGKPLLFKEAGRNRMEFGPIDIGGQVLAGFVGEMGGVPLAPCTSAEWQWYSLLFRGFVA